MKHKSRREKTADHASAEFAEILYGNDAPHQGANRQAQRKAQQFCRQVQRALNLALTDLRLLDTDYELYIDEVSPAPDCGHLLVHVFVTGEISIPQLMNALRNKSPQLRTEVAMAIARKRAPELMFVPITESRGLNE